MNLDRQTKIVVAATAALSGLAGAAAGYTTAVHGLRRQYAQIAAQEIQDAREFYSALHKKDDYATPESAAEAMGISPEAEKELTEAAIALQRYQGKDITVDVEEIETDLDEISTNVFTNSPHAEVLESDIDYDQPYVISADVFEENEDNYVQVSLTWFEGDEVLVDEKDDPIDDVEAHVGEANLKKFGGISKDPNVVYVRNHNMNMDFEVLRSRSTFAETVHGVIKHAYSRPPQRRFRGDDE